jgi:hypothetical protein
MSFFVELFVTISLPTGTMARFGFPQQEWWR